MLWWDCDSICSIPTTFEVRERSKLVTIRLSISSGDRPPYCHTMLTTGMSIYGKISTGRVAIATPPRIAISTAITTNVYGRRSASLTIHITREGFYRTIGCGINRVLESLSFQNDIRIIDDVSVGVLHFVSKLDRGTWKIH